MYISVGNKIDRKNWPIDKDINDSSSSSQEDDG